MKTAGQPVYFTSSRLKHDKVSKAKFQKILLIGIICISKSELSSALPMVPKLNTTAVLVAMSLVSLISQHQADILILIYTILPPVSKTLAFSQSQTFQRLIMKYQWLKRISINPLLSHCLDYMSVWMPFGLRNAAKTFNVWLKNYSHVYLLFALTLMVFLSSANIWKVTNKCIFGEPKLISLDMKLTKKIFHN